MKHLAVAAILAATSSAAPAATIDVGAGQLYATLAAAAAAASPGDTVVVHPGNYTGATWHDDDLTIRAAVPGTVVVRGGTVGGKGLFVTKGNDIIVSGLRFENARVPSGNGAGIRAEGSNLTVLDCVFFGNEMGILANPAPGSTLVVRGSSFDRTRSRRAGSIGHGIYAGGIDRLIVENSTFRRGAVGHYIKSRAAAATISGNTIDDTFGSASYLIDLAEGGAARIANNVLVKGTGASNCCTAIAYGFEMHKGGGYINAPGRVLVSGNRFTNFRSGIVSFFANRSDPPNPASLTCNRIAAKRGTVRLRSGVDTEGAARR